MVIFIARIFFGAHLERADFSESNLAGALLNHATFDQDTKFPGANLNGANLSFIKLAGDFSGADLSGAHFGCTQFEGVKFDSKTILKDLQYVSGDSLAQLRKQIEEKGGNSPEFASKPYASLDCATKS